MKTFNTVNIIRTPADNANYLFFAEFFKLCGIFVVKSEGKPFMETEMSQGKRGAPDRQLDITKNYQWLNVDTRNGEQVKQLLSNGVLSILKSGNEIPGNLNALIQAYVDADLVHQNTLERYFYNPSRPRVRRCLEAFKKAIRILDSYTNVSAGQADNWYRYFIINCKNKVNTLSSKLKLEESYNTVQLIQDAMGLGHNGYRQGYVLAGNIADSNWKYTYMSPVLYDAAKQIDRYWDSYINYKKGRYVEKIEDNKSKALMYYNRSYEMAPWNYRALYKVAIMNYSLGEIPKATEAFLKIDRLFQICKEKGDLQPIHLEYLIKSYRKLEEIYRIWYDELALAELMNTRIRGLQRFIKTDQFFDRFFQDELNEKWADEERESLIKNLGSGEK